MAREINPCVYLLASRRHGTLYIGVTSDLMSRLFQHREGLTGGFTARYAVNRLVWFEMHETMEAAIVREKRLKNWKRDWKIALIEERNPDWHDLAPGFGFEPIAVPNRPYKTLRHPDESQDP